MKRATFLMALLMALTFAGCAWDNENVQRPNGGNTFIDPAVDSDNDTIPDYDEGILVNKDTDGDTLPDYLDMDSDGDTIGDAMDTSPQGGDDSKIKNGEACQENSQCQSGNCFMNQVCRTASWKNADNMACHSNEHCASNLCVSGICKANNSGSNNSGSNNSGGSNSGGSIGSTCAVNSDCQSKLCVNSKCVAISGTGVNGSNSTGLGSGVANSSCSLNRDCESGLCDGGKCVNDCSAVGCSEPYTVCRYNKCIPVDVIGEECNGNSDCNVGFNCCNGFCIAGTCEPGVRCSSGNVICSSSCESSTWGRICGCSKHAQCGNGYYCSGDDICTPKRTVGSACKYNSECQSDACISGTCQQKLDDGEYCDYHAWCKSGTCYDTYKERLAEISDAYYNSNETYCIPKLKSGEECLYDKNCVSDHCYQNKCK